MYGTVPKNGDEVQVQVRLVHQLVALFVAVVSVNRDRDGEHHQAFFTPGSA